MGWYATTYLSLNSAEHGDEADSRVTLLATAARARGESGTGGRRRRASAEVVCVFLFLALSVQEQVRCTPAPTPRRPLDVDRSGNARGVAGVRKVRIAARFKLQNRIDIVSACAWACRSTKRTQPSQPGLSQALAVTRGPFATVSRTL